MTNERRAEVDSLWSASLIGLVVLCVLVAFGMWGCPQYNAYRASVRGEGAFMEAEADRRIKVLEAQAALDSAKLYRQAEVERARGVKEANDIIADGLKGHDEYLRYLWIEKVSANPNREVIYVPTEASLPILEAGKRGVGDVRVRCTDEEIAAGCKVLDRTGKEIEQ